MRMLYLLLQRLEAPCFIVIEHCRRVLAVYRLRLPRLH